MPYTWPGFIQPRSNRESFRQSVTLWDDDTGDPLNMSGISGNGSPGTFASWTVTVGANITASVTPITFPAYPFGADLSTLSLTIAAGLTINAGDPVTIADATHTFNGYVLTYTSTTGLLTVQIGLTFQFEIRRGGPRDPGTGYVPWWDFGVAFDHGPLIKAALGSGVLFVEQNTIQIFIPESQMRSLQMGTHVVALTLADASPDQREVFVCDLPISWGAVTT